MILIIDDDSVIRSSLSLLLKREKYDVTAVTTPDEALSIVRAHIPQVILMDMNYGFRTDGEDGITLLRQVKIFCPDVPVILITAWGSIELAVKGMNAGAFDFITKPWDNMALLRRIETAVQLTSKDKIESDNSCFDRSKIIGKSKALNDVLTTIQRISHTNASVLITGESGTGKELIAEAIHNNSPRVKQPFVKVNLGGISQSLFESEMFGHKRGAFTDAKADRLGRIEMAHKGTLFLDEIGELDLSCQVKLLRVLQEQTFEVLGDSKPRKVDIRVVSATNADLRRMVIDKTFREDLFYRINLITVHLPALRERREDIPLLVRHFADKLCSSNKIQPVEFSKDAMDFLCKLPYPGNIRELKNLVERIILVSENNIISLEDVKSQYIAPLDSANDENKTWDGMTLEEIEKQAVISALKKYSNNISQAAKSLGTSRMALYRRMEKYGINLTEQNE